MNAVFDFILTKCPNCGKDFKFDSLSRQDYFAGAAQGCNCGFSWQYVSTEKIMEIAKDLAYYHNK